ncbi:MAG: SAM-dependent methyltransferase [Bacteroidales bacterium]
MPEPALYLIPVSLDDATDPKEVLPEGVLRLMAQLDEFIVENARSARRFLRKAGHAKDFDQVTLHILDKHTPITEASTYLQSLKKGMAVGLLSEAGTPCIADPGAQIVRLCQEQAIKVVPLTGPSSILLALMGSGFNGQNFAFNGYLPIHKQELKKKLKELELAALAQDQTQIFIETPYRNNQMLEMIVSVCSESTRLCVAAEITTPREKILTQTIRAWKKQLPDLHKKPTVFLIYQGA